MILGFSSPLMYNVANIFLFDFSNLHIALTVSDICCKLVCFQNTITYNYLIIGITNYVLYKLVIYLGFFDASEMYFYLN